MKRKVVFDHRKGVDGKLKVPLYTELYLISYRNRKEI